MNLIAKKLIVSLAVAVPAFAIAANWGGKYSNRGGSN